MSACRARCSSSEKFGTKYKPRENGEASCFTRFRAEGCALRSRRMARATGSRHEVKAALSGSLDRHQENPTAGSATTVAVTKQQGINVEVTGSHLAHAVPVAAEHAVSAVRQTGGAARALMGAIDQKEFMIAAMAVRTPRCGTCRWASSSPLSSPLASGAGMEALTSKRDTAKVRKDLEAAGYNGEKVVFPW